MACGRFIAVRYGRADEDFSSFSFSAGRGRPHKKQKRLRTVCSEALHFRTESRKNRAQSIGALLRAEDAVAGVAEAGDDIAVVVEALVHCGNENVDVGVVFLHAL